MLASITYCALTTLIFSQSNMKKIPGMLAAMMVLVACGGESSAPVPTDGTGNTSTSPNYHLAFVQLAAGTYPASCDGKPGTASIRGDGLISVPGGSFDGSATNVSLTLGMDKRRGSDQMRVYLTGKAADIVYGGGWSLTGQISHLQVNNGNACFWDESQPSSQFAAPLDIGRKVLDLVRGHREVYPAETCSYSGKFLPSLALSVEGNQISFDSAKIDSTLERFSEAVVVEPSNPKESSFSYRADYIDGSMLAFSYGSARGFFVITYRDKHGDTLLSCFRKD